MRVNSGRGAFTLHIHVLTLEGWGIRICLARNLLTNLASNGKALGAIVVHSSIRCRRVAR